MRIMARRFRDRSEAGRVLGELLRSYAGRDDVVVLALPRGGVPVGAEVARALGAPLDVLTVRKLGVPGQRELAMGAVGPGGAVMLDEELINRLRIPQGEVAETLAVETWELQRRERAYRGDDAPTDLEGKTVIVVDDGIATGQSMRVAVRVLRRRGPARVVIAVPAAAAETCEALQSDADEVLCALSPQPFVAVGAWYDDFSQVSDEEVRALLRR
jgi:predicted phosphoribosyltransferase